MLIEIIIYIGLFSMLFSGAFVSAFQTIDAVRYLQNKEERVDSMYFLSRKLDDFIRGTNDWSSLRPDDITHLISTFSGDSLQTIFTSSQIFDTPTSTSRVLLLTIEMNKKEYIFSYVQEK